MIQHTISIAYTEVSDPGELAAADRLLLQNAWDACESAYAPYSGFHVGAALRLANDQIFKGNNQENSAYPSGLCAERVALFAASATFPGVAMQSLAIVAKTAIIKRSDPITPCGGCRQVIAEYEMLSGKPMRILLQGDSAKVWIIEGIAGLLPLMFHGDELKK
jgi:cytidine deaminase